MTKYKQQGFSNTFRNARKGLKIVLKSEVNMRVHFFVAFMVLVLGLSMGLSHVRICILLLAIALVVLAEIMNSAIEFGLDAVFKNKYNRLVGMAKDISAGGVMFATVIAIVIGILIFIPALINFL